MDLSITESTRSVAPREFLFGHHGHDGARTVTLSKAAFGLATGDTVEAGTVVGEITASGLVGPYDNAAADGTEKAAGILFNPVTFGEDDEAFSALLTHATVIEENLPEPVDAAAKADLALITFI